VLSLRASVCRPGELGDVERHLWSCFQGASSELQNPFLAAAFAEAVGQVSDRARVAVIEDAGEVVGFLAYELAARRVAVPIGRMTNNRQAFVHHPDLVWNWADLLRTTRLDVIEFGDLVAGQCDDRRSLEMVDAPVIDTHGGWDVYFDAMRRHKRVRTTLYKERRLRRDVGEITVVCGGGACADLAALVDWKARQYRRAGWPNLLAKSWVPALLELLTGAATDDLRAAGSSLRVDGRVVATDLSLVSGSVFAGWFGAYDPAYSRFSPGAVHTLHVLRAAFDSGVSAVDLHRGDEEYKHLFKTGDVAVGGGYVSLPSARTLAYRMRRAPSASTRAYVLRHPNVRSYVRRSLRRAGSAREGLARWTGRGAPESADT
jgi:CelD/BcsL family acetyltransferase involved in cellulose biosynthesis